MSKEEMISASREMLERVATEANHMLGFTYASNYDECRSAVDELRARLDAPVPPQSDETTVFQYRPVDPKGSPLFGGGWAECSKGFCAEYSKGAQYQFRKLYTHADASEVEQLREAYVAAGEREHALRLKLAEWNALIDFGLAMIDRGIVSIDDQQEFRRKRSRLLASTEVQS